MNAGQYLVSKSPLSSGTALAHLLAMQTGGVRTVFTSMFAVQIDTPRLTLTQRARDPIDILEPAGRKTQVDAHRDDIFVCLSAARAAVRLAPEWLTVTTQRAAEVFVQRDVQSATVRQDYFLEMTQ